MRRTWHSLNNKDIAVELSLKLCRAQYEARQNRDSQATSHDHTYSRKTVHKCEWVNLQLETFSASLLPRPLLYLRENTLHTDDYLCR